MQLLEKVKKDAEEILGDKRLYHNYSHLEEVAEEVITLKDFTEREELLVQVSAYYHDIGYNKDPENHEQVSAIIASKRLREHGVNEGFISEVEELILDTEFLCDTTHELGGFIADADVAHFSYDWDTFCNYRLRAKKEVMPEMNMNEWLELQYKMLQEFNYHTKQGKEKYDEGLKRNKKQLKLVIDNEQDFHSLNSLLFQ